MPVTNKPYTSVALHDADLDALEQQARACGVELELATYKTAHLYINHIARKTRKRGAGRRVMQLLCAFADTRAIRIYLWANDNAEPLVAYYKSFGFVQQYRGYPDGHLRRSPKRLTP